jgi:hypothetical protein
MGKKVAKADDAPRISDPAHGVVVCLSQSSHRLARDLELPFDGGVQQIFTGVILECLVEREALDAHTRLTNIE